MTTDVKGKTKATGAKGKTKATGLKEFLSNLATDPRKLGEFLHAPEPVMSAAASGSATGPGHSPNRKTESRAPESRAPESHAPTNRTDSRAPTSGLTPQPTSLPQFVVYQPRLLVVQPPYYPR
jgi:hypothetical protein